MDFLRRIFTDSLFRRFIIATAFAGAFVWVAVDSFNVRIEVIGRYFLMSILMVGVMVVCAFLIALLLRKVRRRREVSGMDDSQREKPVADDSASSG